VTSPPPPFKANTRQTLAPVITLDIIKESILPMLDRLVSDAIPNIRFNVAKSYAVLIDTLRRLPAEGTLAQLEKSGITGIPAAKGQDLISSQILPNLEKLQQDEDVDVRYFATIAAGNHSERMETSP
jgi:serine/threonine-protein phosphatase 2A regulatory subunit A